MKDTLPAAIIGVIIGYMIHQHWAQLEWFFRFFIG